MQKVFLKAFLIILLLILTTNPAAATEPAVSQINGKVGLTTGSIDNDKHFMGDGSIVFPLNYATGLQVDAGFGEWDSSSIGNTDISRLGFRLFARNPQL